MLHVEDRFFQMQGGTIIVREAVERYVPWLVTFLPDDQDTAYYPGFTISTADSEVPHGPTFEAVAAWAFKQPWVSSWETPEAVHTPPPEGAESLDVPADEWADLQHTAFEHNV